MTKCLHCKKRRANVTKLWSPWLHLSGPLHVVFKNVHTSATHTLIPRRSQKESTAIDHDSQFQVTRRGRNCSCRSAAVEVQLAACTCSIIASPSYLKLRKVTLIGLMGFPSRDLRY